MKKKIKYTDEPLGDLMVVRDFLPPPEELAFKEEGVSAPSFAVVCSGDKVRTIDTVSSSDNLTATQVIVIPQK